MAWAKSTVSTRYGKVAVIDSGGSGLPLVMLHGASASKEAFDRQFEASLATTHRLIALDFVGHGESEDALDPGAAYALGGLAASVEDVLAALGVARAVILGWSLGGHVAIEMMEVAPHLLAGVILTGTPPVGHGPLALLRAFQPRREMLFSSKVDFTRHQSELFARLCYGELASPTLFQAIARCDGRSRPIVFRSLTKRTGRSQKAIVEQTDLPVAIINGAAEPVTRLSYLDSLRLPNLWSGACHVIEGAGHSPFLQRPQRYNDLLKRFLVTVEGAGAVDSTWAARPNIPVRASA